MKPFFVFILLLISQLILSQEISFSIDTPVVYKHFNDIKVYENYENEKPKLIQSYMLTENGDILKIYIEGLLKTDKQLIINEYKNNRIIGNIEYSNGFRSICDKRIFKYNKQNMIDTIVVYSYSTYTKNIWDNEVDSILKHKGKVIYPPIIDTVIKGVDTTFNYNLKKTQREFEKQHLKNSYKETRWENSFTSIISYIDSLKVLEIQIDQLGQKDSIVYIYSKKGKIIQEKHYTSSPYGNKKYKLTTDINYKRYKDSLIVYAISNYNMFKYKFKIRNNLYVKSEIYYYQTDGIYNSINVNNLIINPNIKQIGTIKREYEYDDMNRILKIISMFDNFKVVRTYIYNTDFHTLPDIDYYEY